MDANHTMVKPEPGEPPVAAGAASVKGATGWRRRWPWWSTAGLAAVAVLLLLVSALRRAPEPGLATKKLADVETIRVAPEEYFETLILPARIEADRSVVISSEMPGRLEAWRLGEGDTATAGQVVAELNTDELRAKLAELEAGKASAETSVTMADRQLDLAKLGLETAGKDAAVLQFEVDAATSTLDLARKEFKRIEELLRTEVATTSEFDRARDALTQAEVGFGRAEKAFMRAQLGMDAARVQVRQATAAAELAQARVTETERGMASANVALAKATIRAPFAGRLDKQLIEPGEVVAAGTPLARFYDLSYVRAMADVADRYVPFLDAANAAVKDYILLAMPGAEQHVRVRVLLPGPPKLTGGTHTGLEIDAEVVRIAQSADPASNTFQVELRLRNPGEALKEGILAQAELEYLRYPAAVVIPVRAVQVADVGPRVLVVETQPDGQDCAFVRDIEPVSVHGARLLVSKGIAKGDRLVVAGGKGVLNGEPVNVVAEDGVLRVKDLPAGHTATLPPRPDQAADRIKVAPDYRPGSVEKPKPE